MKGLTINENVADEVSLTTQATIHFEGMHAITYNRVKKMLINLSTATGYGSKVSGIGELLPLPIDQGLHQMMKYLSTKEPEKYTHLQSVAALMGVSMNMTRFGWFNYDTTTEEHTWNDLDFDKKTNQLTRKAEVMMIKEAPDFYLTDKEKIFRKEILQALEAREPFTFTPVGQD